MPAQTRMNYDDRIEEVRLITNKLEHDVEYHRQKAKEHTLIADVLFGISNEFDRRQNELESKREKELISQ